MPVLARQFVPDSLALKSFFMAFFARSTNSSSDSPGI